MGAVEPIRKDTPDEPAKVEPVFPGVEAALAQAIDERRSLSLKTMFLQKTAPHEHERVLSSLFCVTAVVALREKIIELKRERGNAEQRLSELSGNPERREELTNDIRALQAEAGDHSQAEEQKFRASGRQGPFAMVGAAKTKAQGLVTDIERKKRELETLDLDLKRQRDELEKAIKNWGIAIENAEREIVIRREAYGE